MQVAVVEGDILRPGCGLSGADMRRLAGCSVAVHAAASVCFTSPVQESLRHNYHVGGASGCGRAMSWPLLLPLTCALLHGGDVGRVTMVSI
jgi:Male sterility protein